MPEPHVQRVPWAPGAEGPNWGPGGEDTYASEELLCRTWLQRWVREQKAQRSLLQGLG